MYLFFSKSKLIMEMTMTTKTKSEILLSHAERLAETFHVPFKKYIHGKNKTELLRFITDCEKTHGKLPFTEIDKKMTKKEALLEKVRGLPGFKKSWERKSCEELRRLLSPMPEPGKQPPPTPIEEETGQISPIRILDYVNEEQHQIDLKDAILRAFSDAPYDDKVYTRVEKRVFTL